MWLVLVNCLHSYIDNMAKGYNKKYIEKVKFHDIQSSNKANKGNTGVASNDSNSQKCDTNRMAIKR